MLKRKIQAGIKLIKWLLPWRTPIREHHKEEKDRGWDDVIELDPQEFFMNECRLACYNYLDQEKEIDPYTYYVPGEVIPPQTYFDRDEMEEE